MTLVHNPHRSMCAQSQSEVMSHIYYGTDMKNPSLERQRQANLCKSRASLIYIGNFRTAGATLPKSCPIYVSACTDVHVCWCPRWPEEGTEPAGAGIRGSCEPPNVRCWEPDLGPLQGSRAQAGLKSTIPASAQVLGV